MRSATNHYGTLEGGHRTRTRMRHTPQLNWRLSPNSHGSQSHKNHKVGARLHNLIGASQLSREPPKLRDQQGPSRALQVPKRTSSRAPQVPKSNKLLNFDFHVSPWRTQTDATDAMGKNTRSAQNPSLSNPTKATNAIGGRREEDQGRTQQMELQDLDPRASPHLEERWIGGTIDLDLLSLLPLIGGKNHGGIKR